MLKIRKRYNSRPNTTKETVLDNVEAEDMDRKGHERQESFFTTEPAKVPVRKRRNIYI